MAAVAVLSQLTQALSFLKEHPKLSCVLLLLLSSPIYRVLLYFTPLLLSTALCIFALVTLNPYVTATDAEVERQSLLGASAQQLKKKASTSITSTAKERKLEDAASGNGKPSFSSASASSSKAASASTSTSLKSAASPSSSDAETSWFSWMKGLNDIGRAWMENKLTEQGLALSEPANRETLLAFIEGSFADLLTSQEGPSTEIFPVDDNHESAVAVAEPGHSVEKSDEAQKANTLECASEGYAIPKSMKEEEIVCAKASSDGVDGGALIKNAINEETRDVENQAATITPDVCATSEEPSQASAHGKFMQGNSEPWLDDVKLRKHKPHAAYEVSLPMTDGILDLPAATVVPKTPSRIPAPSKLLEASRRIFSKDEQSKTMLPRAPLQASSAAKVNQPFKSSFGSTQSKMESSVSVFKLPARKFLERSRSIPSKEGSKLSSTALETQAGYKGVQSEMKESSASYGNESKEGEGVDAIGVQNTKDVIADVRISDASDFSLGANDDGPRFDEDLKVEEAQALVQSELKMLEVELDEVAAKLPKLDETFAYQKTPIKSTALSHTPTGASSKCNTGLFSVSPAFKAS